MSNLRLLEALASIRVHLAHSDEEFDCRTCAAWGEMQSSVLESVTEIEALRAQVAVLQEQKDKWVGWAKESSAQVDLLKSKLADCQAVIWKRGHDADCPAYPNNLDGSPRGWIGECSDDCGHDRTTGEKA